MCEGVVNKLSIAKFAHFILEVFNILCRHFSQLTRLSMDAPYVTRVREASVSVCESVCMYVCVCVCLRMCLFEITKREGE